jgi:hypothetical protein
MLAQGLRVRESELALTNPREPDRGIDSQPGSLSRMAAGFEPLTSSQGRRQRNLQLLRELNFARVMIGSPSYGEWRCLYFYCFKWVARRS